MSLGFVSMNLVTLLYLAASVCFIQALKGLSHPSTARRGNLFGMGGMAIAVATTVMLILKLQADAAADPLVGSDGGGLGLWLVLLGVVVGGAIGTLLARKVEMTRLPELVAAMHSLIGLAAVFIAVAAVAEPWAFGIVVGEGEPIPLGNKLELFIGTAVGAITFSGSVIAFGKLAGKFRFRLFQGAPVVFPGQHLLNLALAVAMIGLGITFALTQQWEPFIAMAAIAFVLGVLIIIPILIGMMWAIRRHYRGMEGELRPETPLDPADLHPRVVVPIAGINVPAQQAMAFGRVIAGDGPVMAVHVTDNSEDVERAREEWERCACVDAELVVLESPYRSLAGPLLAYIDALHEAYPQDTIVVVLPAIVPDEASRATPPVTVTASPPSS